MFSYFTYISGTASLLGLALQLFNVFPKHAKFRNMLIILILGVFIGTLLNTLDPSHIVFDIKISGFTLFLTFMGIFALSFLIIGVSSKDQWRRDNLITIGVFGFIAFMFVLGISYVTSLTNPNMEKQKLTESEFLLLADSAEKNGNFERAIMHLESIKGRLEKYDIRNKKLEERINQTKMKQIK